MSAKGHFNPYGKPHASHTAAERHAGDLPELGAVETGDELVVIAEFPLADHHAFEREIAGMLGELALDGEHQHYSPSASFDLLAVPRLSSLFRRAGAAHWRIASHLRAG